MNNLIQNLKSITMFNGSRGMLLLRKNSPEILLALGIGGGITATVLACKATIDAVKKKEELEDNFQLMREYLDSVDDFGSAYTQEHYDQNRNQLILLFLLDMAKLYGPAVILGALSVGALVGSNRILNSRNVAAITAFKAMSEAYSVYRKRVKEELGEEMDNYLYYGKKVPGGLKVTDQKGKSIKFDELEADLDGELSDVPSMYARYFEDDVNVYFRRNDSMNHFFLINQQAAANDLLKIRGHLFLNEVYDMLGLPRTREGAVVGWVLGNGDDVISFDIENPYNTVALDHAPQENGRYLKKWLVDFNVDGVIYNII